MVLSLVATLTAIGMTRSHSFCGAGGTPRCCCRSACCTEVVVVCCCWSCLLFAASPGCWVGSAAQLVPLRAAGGGRAPMCVGWHGRWRAVAGPLWG